MTATPGITLTPLDNDEERRLRRGERLLYRVGDTSWLLVVEDVSQAEWGGIVYHVRSPRHPEPLTAVDGRAYARRRKARRRRG